MTVDYVEKHKEAVAHLEAVVSFLQEEIECPIRSGSEPSPTLARRMNDYVEAVNLLQRLRENY